MHSVLNFVESSELEDVWLDELFLKLTDLEAVVADDLEETDPEEPVDDVLLLALLADQQELLLGGDKVGDPVGNRASAWQPVGSFDDALADVHSRVHDLCC